MNLHEYQEKNLSKYEIPVQRGVLVENLSDMANAYDELVAETGSKFV